MTSRISKINWYISIFFNCTNLLLNKDINVYRIFILIQENFVFQIQGLVNISSFYYLPIYIYESYELKLEQLLSVTQVYIRELIDLIEKLEVLVPLGLIKYFNVCSIWPGLWGSISKFCGRRLPPIETAHSRAFQSLLPLQHLQNKNFRRVFEAGSSVDVMGISTCWYLVNGSLSTHNHFCTSWYVRYECSVTSSAVRGRWARCRHEEPGPPWRWLLKDKG